MIDHHRFRMICACAGSVKAAADVLANTDQDPTRDLRDKAFINIGYWYKHLQPLMGVGSAFGGSTGGGASGCHPVPNAGMTDRRRFQMISACAGSVEAAAHFLADPRDKPFNTDARDKALSNITYWYTHLERFM